jgi:hypothetical protein
MFAQVDHPGLGLLMDPSNYFESNNIDPMDGILHQVFDTLSDKIKIAHAKDVARAGDDKSEKHADIGDDDALASHTFRGVGEIVLNAAGTGSLNHNLTCNFWRKSIRTFRSLSSIWMKPMCRAVARRPNLQEAGTVPQLFGTSMTRQDIAARAGALSQFAGVRLVTPGDGVERGLQMLEFRTGSGLRFSVLVDRAMDLAEVEHQGRAIGWHAAAGFRHPGLHDAEGEGGFGWARSFSGFLVT